MVANAEYDAVERLTQTVRDAIRMMTNGYTALSPTKHKDGSSTIRIKDKRSPKMLTVTITESKE